MKKDLIKGIDPYAAQIDAVISIISKNPQNARRHVIREVLDPKGGSGAIVYRQTNEAEYLYDARWTLQDSGHIVDEGNMHGYIGAIGDLLDGNRYPPICVFNGERVLTISEIREQHPKLHQAFDAAEAAMGTPPFSP